MNRIHSPIHDCTCGTQGSVHPASCGCRRAEEFLAAPTAAYNASRREFLTKALTGGVALAALPMLLAEEARADMFTPSVSDQKRLGDQAAQGILRKYKVVKDSRHAISRRRATGSLTLSARKTGVRGTTASRSSRAKR